PEEFLDGLGRHIADQMPSGWVHKQLARGRAAVLVDGIDELRESERDAARTWLAELTSTYPTARYVITSRPGAAAKDWLVDGGFDSAMIEQMSPDSVQTFIAHWHETYILSCTDPDEQQRAEAYGREMAKAVIERRHIRMLATNPLLAALLCAL